jgi:hypothetical protein
MAILTYRLRREEKLYMTYFTFTLFSKTKNVKDNINEKCVDICNIIPVECYTEYST